MSNPQFQNTFNSLKGILKKHEKNLSYTLIKKIITTLMQVMMKKEKPISFLVR